MRNLPLFLTTVHTVKSKGKILQNVVTFSEFMNFTVYVPLFKPYLIFSAIVKQSMTNIGAELKVISDMDCQLTDTRDLLQCLMYLTLTFDTIGEFF